MIGPLSAEISYACCAPKNSYVYKAPHLKQRQTQRCNRILVKQLISKFKKSYSLVLDPHNTNKSTSADGRELKSLRLNTFLLLP